MSTSKPRPSDILLRDPLSEVTRNERRTLLGASAVGIIIVKTGLVPSKISALGIEFTQTDQRSLLLAIAAIIIYFIFAFIVYAASDFLNWRLGFYSAVRDIRVDRIAKGEQDKEQEFYQRVEDELRRRYRFRLTISNLSSPMSVVRAIFEFALPIIISVYAVINLVFARV